MIHHETKQAVKVDIFFSVLVTRFPQTEKTTAFNYPSAKRSRCTLVSDTIPVTEVRELN